MIPLAFHCDAALSPRALAIEVVSPTGASSNTTVLVTGAFGAKKK